MKIVAPLRRHPKSSLAPRTQHARIVQIALRNERNAPARPCGESIDLLGQLAQERERARIKDSMNRVEPQRINMKILEPVECVLDEKAPHLIAVRAIKVQRRSPRRLVTIRKIRTILAQVITLGSQVVVYDVQRHGEPSRMRGIHEALQIARRSVAILNGKRVHAVVAPIPRSRELGDWHYFNGRHAKGCKLIQRGKQRSESSVVR